MLPLKRQLLMAAALSVSLLSLASAETAGELLDDSTVATRVKAELIDSEEAPAGDLNVEVFKGATQLSGFVDSQAEKDAALSVAAKTEGVRQVLDGIVVQSASRSAGQLLDDTTIQTKLKAELADAEGFGEATAIVTHVRLGEVILAGFVESSEVKSGAGKVAEGISGVTKVHNRIAIED